MTHSILPEPCEVSFQALVNHNPEPVIVLDEQGFILYGNPASGGYLPQVPARQHLRDVIHPDDYASLHALLLADPAPAGPVRLPVHRARGAGDWQPLEGTALSVRHSHGVRLILLYWRDVTRRQLEQQRAASLRAVAAALTATHRPGQVMEVVVREGLAVMGAVGGVIVALTPEGDALEVLASLGYPPAAREWPRVALTADVPVAQAVRLQRPLFLPEAEWHSRYSHLLHLRPAGARSAVVLPLTVDAATIGAISLSFAEDRSFDGSEQEYLEALASQCALALNRDRLYRELEDREARHRKLTQHSPGMVTILGPDGTLRHESESVLGILGYRPEELVGRPVLEFVHPDDHAAALAAIGQAVRQPEEAARVTCRFRHRDGSWRWLECLGTGLLHDPHVRGVLVNSWDVTARVEAEHELRRSEAFLRRVMHASADCIKILDRAGRVLFVNEGGQRLLGTGDATALLGRPWLDDWTGEQAAAAAGALEAARGGRTGAFQGRLPTAAGVEKWWDVAVTSVPDEHGQPERLLVISRDVTAAKAAEREQTDHNEILRKTVQGQPLGEILHEIALMVERQAPEHFCSITVAREGRLALMAAPNAPDTLGGPLSEWDIHGGPGACSEAAATGELVVVEDITAHPAMVELREVLLAEGVRAVTSMPILDGDGQVLGVLALYAQRPGRPGRQSLNAMEKGRHLAAIAMEQQRLTGRLQHQAQHDSLTGLPNRALFTERLRTELQAAERQQHSLALLFIDLDDFKGVNDSLGHEAGDQVLLQAAERLRRCVRHEDTLARLGGDEFTAILPLAGEAEATQVAQRVLAAFALPVQAAGRDLYVSASVGISVHPDAGRNVGEMLRHADMAMYRAKQRKTGFAVFESEMNRQAFEKLHLTTYLRRAVELRELELHYQPQVELRDGTLVGVEALLRWRHPVLGMVSPAQFIPLAEETGLIVPIGEWVLREACAQGVAWQREGRAPVRIAVNVSAVQFEHPEFEATVARCLSETGLAPQLLELELTERVVMTDVQESAARMAGLRALGVSLSVDDFGTGYSSLSYLPRLPINLLKIDRMFVRDLHPSSPTFPVVKAIVSLAQSLGLTTVAEGIETEGELGVLRGLRCDLGQGFLFGRPVPASELRFTGHREPGRPG